MLPLYVLLSVLARPEGCCTAIHTHTILLSMPMPPCKQFPALLLLVSGGHNMLVLCSGVGKHRIIGTTLDDSVGECFDKTARCVGENSVFAKPLLTKIYQ